MLRWCGIGSLALSSLGKRRCPLYDLALQLHGQCFQVCRRQLYGWMFCRISMWPMPTTYPGLMRQQMQHGLFGGVHPFYQHWDIVWSCDWPTLLLPELLHSDHDYPYWRYCLDMDANSLNQIFFGHPHKTILALVPFAVFDQGMVVHPIKTEPSFFRQTSPGWIGIRYRTRLIPNLSCRSSCLTGWFLWALSGSRGYTGFPARADPSAAVGIIGGVIRQIKMKNVLEVLYINTTGSYIRCDNHMGFLSPGSDSSHARVVWVRSPWRLSTA